MKILKICVGASAGGHMNQLLRLLEHAGDWPSSPSIYITTQPELAGKLQKRGKTYVIGECNRYHPLAALVALWRAFGIMIMDKPDIVITTGSLPLALVCLVAKLFGKKVIWIDSIANAEKFSMSGRLMYRFADLFLTQWEELAQAHEKAEFAGAIL
jgi:UDP-N-acetylglucosamine:LPS N-acetylglucosamine transferase